MLAEGRNGANRDGGKSGRIFAVSDLTGVAGQQARLQPGLAAATTLPRILRPLPFTSFFHFLPLIPNHFPLPPAMSLQSPCYL